MVLVEDCLELRSAVAQVAVKEKQEPEFNGRHSENNRSRRNQARQREG